MPSAFNGGSSMELKTEGGAERLSGADKSPVYPTEAFEEALLYQLARFKGVPADQLPPAPWSVNPPKTSSEAKKRAARRPKPKPAIRVIY